MDAEDPQARFFGRIAPETPLKINTHFGNSALARQKRHVDSGETSLTDTNAAACRLRFEISINEPGVLALLNKKTASSVQQRLRHSNDALLGRFDILIIGHQ
jgi:hypothetical protein